MRDIYVAPHGGSFVIRIDTFEQALRFFVPKDKAEPLLAHIAPSFRRRDPEAESAPEKDDRRPLLWPKVSPLAIWAVICSALVFVPVLGLVPAVATVTLLILHRRRVRRAAAWRHSRTLCTTAFILLVAGLAVSGLTTWSLSQPIASDPAEMVFAHAEESVRNWGVIAGGIIVVLLSLTVHEAAHAITAWWLGDGFARSQGRVTLNPLAHMDPFGTVILPLILVMAGGPVFGYAKPAPVRVESLRRRRRAHILISIAGPGSNLVLAAASLMLLLVVGCVLRFTVPQTAVANLSAMDFTTPVRVSGFVIAPVIGALCTILKLSFIVNTFLAVFNLIPIPPLDGSWVLEHLFPNSLGRLYERIRPYGFFIFLGAIYAGLFQYLAIPVLFVMLPGLFMLARASGW